MWNVNLPDAEWYDQPNDALVAVINEVNDQKEVAIDTETTGLVVYKDVPLFWSLAWGNRRLCMPTKTLPYFQQAFRDPKKEWIFANAKFDMHMLANAGVSFAGRAVDTAVMHALLYEEESHALKDMAKEVLGWRWKDFFDQFKREIRPDGEREEIGDMLLRFEQDNKPALVEYASNDAFGTLKIKEKLEQELKRTHIYSLYPDVYETMWDLFSKVEVPFTTVLWGCEREGVFVNQEYLSKIRTPIMEELDYIGREINNLAGEVMNPNSTQQLRRYFFDKLKLAPRTYTKGGKSGVKEPSVDAGFLEHYSEEGVPMAKMMLRQRDLAKTLGTYVEGLTKRQDARGRVHTRFNQDIARCMPKGELVLTNKGYQPVEDISVGSWVLAHTGIPRRVLETSTHAPQPIYRVRLSNGLHLRTTGNHEYRTGTGWTRADVLRPGDVVTVHATCQQDVRVGLGWNGIDETFSEASVHEILIEDAEVTYGLTVEEDHSHVTGGIVTHNTGRLSSSDPNIQNIRRPDEDEFKLRGAFQVQPDSGCTLIVGDYEQLEMRLLACASQEPAMCKIFHDGKDIHMGNAALVFGPIYEKKHGWKMTYEDIVKAKKIDKKVKFGELPPAALDDRMHLALYARQAAKAIGFGLNYGMKENKLAHDLNCEKAQAKDLMEAYLATYPAVEAFYADAIAETQQTGYSFTLLGRRRYHPEILSNRKMDRWEAERKCVNNQIQGTAADAARLAMINIANARLDLKYGCRMLLQVHDELMFECPNETAAQAMAEIKHLMEHPFPTDLAVPLDVSIGTGPAWDKAK